MAETPLLTLRGVRKSYDGETLAVRDLDLDIRGGEFLTLLGPSGSGKTTTLVMVAGFETPTAGEILLDGKSLTHLPPHKRDIGMVFQNYALFPHMTVAENIAFPLRVRRMGREDVAARVNRALDMVQLGGYAARRPAQLSGGQQQRVALARALVFEPKLVLMDEPLGALDKQLREQMQLEIKHLHQRIGVTFIYVTHDQSEALTMSDRIAVFNHGAVQQLDTPSALYEEPRTSFVARFIGENNSLAGAVESVDGGYCRVALDNGGRVLARAVNIAGAGARTLVSVRPERVQLRPPPEVENRFEGVVRELIYCGDHTRLRLGLAGGGEVTVKCPAAALDGLSPGAALPVGFAAGDCRALDPA
jgi:putative spermidine/putrescine transport system ATP-binding protein